MSSSTRPSAILRALGRVFRLGIGLGLTAWLLIQADPAAVWSSFTRARPSWVAAAVILVLVDRGIMAYRWLLLLRAIEPSRRLALGAVMRIFFVSTFIGTFLPASVGGDAVRTVSLARLHVPAADALASVVVDRLLGVLSVVIMGAAGLLAAHQIMDTRGAAALAALIFLSAAGAGLLLFDARILSGLVRWLPLGRLPRLEHTLLKLLAAIRQFGSHRRALALVLTGSIGVQVLRTLQAWCLGLALGLPVHGIWYFAFIPAVIMAMSLPISLMGLGTSQLSFQLLFGLVGVGEADAWALSVLFLALGVVGNLPGGWLFMFGRSSGTPTRPAAAES